MRILTILGTRPEAIKLAPVLRALARDPRFDSIVGLSGQHRDLVRPILETFQIVPDHDVGPTPSGLEVPELLRLLQRRLEPLIVGLRPRRVVVQGDTATALAAARCAHGCGIPVSHVEAGLRTHDLANPFPEEQIRVAIARIADQHLAPTARAAANLVEEGVDPGSITVTGNPVVDALHFVLHQGLAAPAAVAGIPERLRSVLLEPPRNVVLLTGHRREGLEKALPAACEALRQVLEHVANLEVVFPVHPNPRVQAVARSRLGGHPRIHLTPPLPYPSFLLALSRARLVVTDSGGVQEEAPSLGVPVLVTRTSTERPEAVAGGTAFVVGTTVGQIRAGVLHALTRPPPTPGANPFGDGRATARILENLAAAHAHAVSRATAAS